MVSWWCDFFSDEQDLNNVSLSRAFLLMDIYAADVSHDSTVVFGQLIKGQPGKTSLIMTAHLRGKF